MSIRMGAALIALATAILIPAPAQAAVSDYDLALRWAPIHRQDTDSSDYDADYLSTVDFDGDWNAGDNWGAQDDNPAWLKGAAYYSVVETSTHWFIVYAFYHPRDWVDYPDPFNLDHHENDMEGIQLTVRRNGSTYGVLEAAVTVAHTNFYSYTPAGSPYVSGRESIDGQLRIQNGRPVTFQEAKGHGLYAWNGSGFPGGDGVIYYPTSGAAEVPSGGNDSSVAYRLINAFDTVWAHRNDSQTFASWGTFRGDDGQDNAANAAWGWDDGDDGSDLQRGLLATDPAKLVSIYFDGEGSFSRTYVRNGYL